MLDKYVVVRTEVGRLESLDAGGSTVTVDEVELTPQESRTLARDPQTIAVAPSIPMKLIEPVPFEGDEEADETDGDEEEQEVVATWGVQAVRAHESPFDGSGVTVAVLDTGIAADHPAFAGVTLVQRDFTGEGEADRVGHGTHCAGTIFGRDVDGNRIGVARGVTRALIGKVLGQRGGSSAGVAGGIIWAVDQGADIISMSLGIDFPGLVNFLIGRGVNPNAATSIALEGYRKNVFMFSALTAYIKQASGVTLIVAASGNESNRLPAGSNPPGYEVAAAPPAVSTGIIAVGALMRTDSGLAVAPFSNDQVQVSAPGVQVLSAWPATGLRQLNGTSMATPHVAGVAALWAQKQRQTTGQINEETLRAQLIATATYGPLQSGWVFDDVGNGLVQAPL